MHSAFAVVLILRTMHEQAENKICFRICISCAEKDMEDVRKNVKDVQILARLNKDVTNFSPDILA